MTTDVLLSKDILHSLDEAFHANNLRGLKPNNLDLARFEALNDTCDEEARMGVKLYVFYL